MCSIFNLNFQKGLLDPCCADRWSYGFVRSTISPPATRSYAEVSILDQFTLSTNLFLRSTALVTGARSLHSYSLGVTLSDVCTYALLSLCLSLRRLHHFQAAWSVYVEGGLQRSNMSHFVCLLSCAELIAVR